MSDSFDQIEIPPSFAALYTSPSGRPTAPRTEVRARYELCEDLAQHLTEVAQTTMFDLGLSEDLVLARCLTGLQAEPAVVTAGEAVWVIRRLAELLGWEDPGSLHAPDASSGNG
jgi:hypothetical protein